MDNLAPNPGDTIVYTIVVKNNGHLKANNITIQDILPAGITYVSSTVSQGDLYQETNPGEWFANDIENGLSATLTITATVDTGTVGSAIINTASILSVDEPDSYTYNDTASVTIANWRS